jgi:polyribonucleotide nucleotidyltransferase
LFSLQVVTGTADKRVLMLESEASVLDRELFLEAVNQGLDVGAAIAAEIKSLCADVQKRELPAVLDLPVSIIDDMRLLIGQRLRAIFYDRSHDKTSRDLAMFGVRDEAVAMLRKEHADTDLSIFYECFNRVTRDLAVSLAIDEGIRVDGRGVDEIRKITCESDLHPPLHGSALFTRGQTQVGARECFWRVQACCRNMSICIFKGKTVIVSNNDPHHSGQ